MNVDVIYQGLALVKGAPARSEGAGLFVEWELPMPVGTPLELVTPDGTRSGRVESVVEGAGAGMLVSFRVSAEPNAPMQEMKSAPVTPPASEKGVAEAENDDEPDDKSDDKPEDGGRRPKKPRRQRKTVIGH
jgi:hypothetical protein